MEVLKIGLFDTSFRHHPNNTVPGNSTEYIDWNRSSPASESLVCFTNEQILSEKRELVPKSRRVALLYESRDTMSWLYRDAEKVISEFEYFFTHERHLLENFSNTRWIPGNGIWIGNNYGGGIRRIYKNKDRLMSFITSKKQTTTLQKLRVLLADELGNSSQYSVDVFLRSANAFDYIPISHCLSRYHFSLIIENTRTPWYFTEKLLNCFAVGTIPIYLGASEINFFFNSRGIIQFSNRSQLLNEIIPNLSQSFYNLHIDAVADNFERCLEFTSIEKVMFHTLNQEKSDNFIA